MLEVYNQHLSERHLEVGPGSGWYLANATLPAAGEVTLVDLNPTPLAYTRRRLESLGHQVHTAPHNVLEPVPASVGTGFTSIGINFVMHCVPGSFAQKGVAFAHLARVLAEDGTLFGATILNRRPSTLFGRILTVAYRRLGAFNNTGDDQAGLETALQTAFEQVSITEVGDVTLFTARQPRH
ncbi:methyltransferase domain-containing protein [Nocardia brasiliensis]